MLTVRYPAALSGNADQCVVYLSRRDLATLMAGCPLHTGLIVGDLPLFLALGDKDDAETERVLSVGEGRP